MSRDCLELDEQRGVAGDPPADLLREILKYIRNEYPPQL